VGVGSKRWLGFSFLRAEHSLEYFVARFCKEMVATLFCTTSRELHRNQKYTRFKQQVVSEPFDD